MTRHFDSEIKQVKDKLLLMGGTAEHMLRMAVHGLASVDTAEDAAIDREEFTVNELHIEIDETVVKLLALQHPVANDLRFLVMATKISDELERVADLSVNTSQSSDYLNKEPVGNLPKELNEMATLVQQMLRDCLDSLAKEDPKLANKVLDTDDSVDEKKKQILQFGIDRMQADPNTVNWAVSLILISRNLERIGDHATNIAEEVIYFVKGRDVRHQHIGVKE